MPPDTDLAEAMGSTISPKRVLLLTNSEYGQANVFLATSYALLTLEDEDVEVHFASFPPVKPLVSTTSDHAQQDRPGARPIIFHPIDGLDMVSAWSRPEIVAEQMVALSNSSLLPLVNEIRRTLVLLKVTLPWTGPEFIQIMHSITTTIQTVQPAIIAVDPAFSPALTALRHLHTPFIILSPNTIKDFAMPLQPNAEALWKYPCLGTPYPYPLPAVYTPHNIFLILLSLAIALCDPTRRNLTAHLKTHYHPEVKLTTLSDLSLHPAGLGAKFLVANLPEIEFPLRVVPPHVVPCGPMLRPFRPVGEVDAELAGWLREGRVVYVNLGTHVVFDEGMVGEMAGAVRVLLDYVRGQQGEGVRVLWKIPAGGGENRGVGEVLGRVLGKELEGGVVRVVEWIQAEPVAVLESGSVVCAVHHGGANSFLESVWAGVPQVVLPVWMDTFDFARRAELLGIGRWGNHLSGKVCESSELGEVLVDVVAGGRSSAYAQKAKELAELCRRSGGGRVIAARHILAEIDDHATATSRLCEAPSEGEKESDPLLGGNSNGHC